VRGRALATSSGRSSTEIARVLSLSAYQRLNQRSNQQRSPTTSHRYAVFLLPVTATRRTQSSDADKAERASRYPAALGMMRFSINSLRRRLRTHIHAFACSFSRFTELLSYRHYDEIRGQRSVDLGCTAHCISPRRARSSSRDTPFSSFFFS